MHCWWVPLRAELPLQAATRLQPFPLACMHDPYITQYGAKQHTAGMRACCLA